MYLCSYLPMFELRSLTTTNPTNHHLPHTQDTIPIHISPPPPRRAKPYIARAYIDWLLFPRTSTVEHPSSKVLVDKASSEKKKALDLYSLQLCGLRTSSPYLPSFFTHKTPETMDHLYMPAASNCCASPLQYAHIPDMSSCGYSEGSSDPSPSPPLVRDPMILPHPTGAWILTLIPRCLPTLMDSNTTSTRTQ